MSNFWQEVIDELFGGMQNRLMAFSEEEVQREMEAEHRRNGGFTGVLCIADEWDDRPCSVWHYLERPKTFTPAEFNKLWDGFSELRKVEYVLSLIT